MNLPEIALSVRQPWAWAIIFAGKDIENRSWSPLHANRRNMREGRVCIHAAQGMTRDEYESAASFINDIIHPGRCPAPHELVRGAIIGTAIVRGGVGKHSPYANSRWWAGPWGILLESPDPVLVPIRASGELGWFKWRRSDASPIEPAKWMLPKEEPML